MSFEWHFRAACGYAELGMTRQSIAELNALEQPHQNRPEVLQLRLHHLMRGQRWASALRISQKLCRAAPDCSAGYLHAGFCLHELGKTAEAKQLLLKGPAALLKEPIYYYNMGCYEALPANEKSARINLKPIFRMASSFGERAKKDRALGAVKDLF